MCDTLLKLVAIRIIKGTYILFTSDDWDQYLPAIKKAFGYSWRPKRQNGLGRKRKLELRLAPNILYGIVKKIKGAGGRVVKIIRRIVCGSEASINKTLRDSPVSNVLNTSYVERINGTFRAFCSRLVRKAYSFSKKASYHDSHIFLVTSYYNFIKPHKTLTRQYQRDTTPAMAIGLTEGATRPPLTKIKQPFQKKKSYEGVCEDKENFALAEYKNE